MCNACGGNSISRDYKNGEPVDTCLVCGADVTEEMRLWQAKVDATRAARFAGAQR